MKKGANMNKEGAFCFETKMIKKEGGPGIKNRK